MANDSSGIVIDKKSGIPEEEQREILAQINSIAEKNRLSLSEGNNGKDRKPRFKAKKSGGVFPVVVNIAAIAALAGGLVVLSSMQGKTGVQARTGTIIYNSVERALIEEIRKETITLLEAKEREISLIISKLEGIDAELLGLNSGGNDFTAEERAARTRLMALQEEYHSDLAVLQNERSKILEDARAREAVLQAQLESRARELAGVSENAASGAAVGGDNGVAGRELERINLEQIQAAGIEAQMGAFFSNLNAQIADNSYDEAAGTIKSMRAFINTPAFQSLRSIQARKEMYAQAINSFETMVEEALKHQDEQADGANESSQSGLQARIAQLEHDLAEKDKTIEAISSQGSGAAQRLRDIEKTNGTLQTDNRQLQTRNSQLTADLERQTKSATDLQRELQTEKAETARLNQLVTARESTISERDNAIRTREAAIANRNDVITRIRSEVELDREYDEIPPAEIKARITRIQAALRSLQ
jgi:uncharacterized coiled-coil protein SlyX